jgi:putative transposase
MFIPRPRRTEPGHRKTCKRWNNPGDVHELTFCFQNRRRLLNATIARLMLDQLEASRREYNFALLAYVLMPTHVHLLVHPRQRRYNISDVLMSIKLTTSSRYAAMLKQSSPSEYAAHLVTMGRRSVFRLWLRGGGYDRNIQRVEEVGTAIAYIEFNPVRAGLSATPESWPWSSARSRGIEVPGLPSPDPVAW